jgi:hypothetical protein
LLRTVRNSYQPARLTGVDIIDWLDDDLRQQVELVIGSAERVVSELEQPADRVLLVETLEHLEAPWMLLRAAARCVAPGGRIVVSTPNVASLRHRLELLVRGDLTAFRPDNLPHMTPVLPHVVERVLREEGMRISAGFFVGRDIVPWSGGRSWPLLLHGRFPRATSVSLVIVADRETGSSD